MTDRLHTFLEIHSYAEKGLMALSNLNEDARLEEIIRDLLFSLKAASEAEIRASIPGEEHVQ